MPSNSLPKPAPRSSIFSLSGARLRGTKAVGVVLVAGVSLVVAAAHYPQASPVEQARAAGIEVQEQSVRLAKNAPQWSVIKLGRATSAQPHWTEPVAARVRIADSHAARVGSPLSGKVTAVFVELGQRVKKGDPLLSVASQDLATLRSEAAKAKIDLEVAKAQHSRVRDMVAERLVPGKEELLSRAQELQAETQLKYARSKMSSLKVSALRDNEFTVRAPRDGVVVDKVVLAGQEVSSDGTLLQIADVSDVWVVADLFESDAAGITEGTKVRVTLPSMPNFNAETTVQSISAVVDPTRHSIPVRVVLPNADGKLRPNQYAEMRFEVALDRGTTEVDASALVSDGAVQHVYVETEPGTLSKRKVVAGPLRDGKVAILDGLADGETVVVQGGILLDNHIQLAN